jgi:hypothetical protein
MAKIVFAVVAAVVVTTVIFFGFVLYTWTAIHSGWSASGIHAFYTATWVVPPVLGGLSGWWTYHYWRWQ